MEELLDQVEAQEMAEREAEERRKTEEEIRAQLEQEAAILREEKEREHELLAAAQDEATKAAL